MAANPYQIEKSSEGFVCSPVLTPYVYMVEADLRTQGMHHALHAAVDVLNILLAAGWRPPNVDFVAMPRTALDDLLDELDDGTLVTSPEGDPVDDAA